MAFDIYTDNDGNVKFDKGDIVIANTSYQCDLIKARNYLNSKKQDYYKILIESQDIYLIYNDLDGFLKTQAPNVRITKVEIDTENAGFYEFTLGQI